MTKFKTVFICQQCGHQNAKWAGRCPSCGTWNSLVEETIQTGKPTATSRAPRAGKAAVPKLLDDIRHEDRPRLITPDKELNRVLGGGIVAGSLVLLGGEPGIGKSTLMLQVAMGLPQVKVLYVSGEESGEQLKMRAERLPSINKECYILTETNVETIVQTAEETEPGLLVIDSIQTLNNPMLESAPGSISQVRECAASLMKMAKELHIPVFLVGHITKDGGLAGPKALEHMVDTVLNFEGDRHLSYRLLRTVKNRFGSTAELGIYEMQGSGLRQVDNPSEILISQREYITPGIAIGATLEGNRPLLVEIQALVSPASYGTPQRSATGFDPRRLNMLLAVLEKRAGYRFGTYDVFLNIAGGLKVEDPAIDLAVCLSLVSSLLDIPLPQEACFAAEVGLGGEIRAVNRIENRIAEADKLGYKTMYLSKYSLKGLDTKKFDLKLKTDSSVEYMCRALFGE